MASDLPNFPASIHLPKLEEQMLAHWTHIDAFRTSLERSRGRPRFSFYDGPPFATGLPHYGHILAGTIKDVVCRYAHQTGHEVERRFGWDCHGLPIEFEIEKELGLKSSHDVKKFGIANYNNECRKIVMRYAREWETIIGRTGRWIDFQNDYKTMNRDFMESVWWVFKQLWEKDLVYRGFKVMPFSTGCTTPLSNFEANMNYKETSDPSLTVTFPLVDSPNTHLLAWTTTPWTLPSNLALCVNAELDYVTVHDAKTGRHYILAECRLQEFYGAGAAYTVLERCKGAALVGKRYVPLFDYFVGKVASAFRVVADSYVSTDSGTGIVHQAPGFGEDDFRVCLASGVLQKGETVCPVDENGCFTADVGDFAGKYIKHCDEEIAARIKAAGRLVKKAAVVHSYPFCWRSESPLIYKAVDAWFVKVESIRDKLLATNEQTYWVPDFVKSKRFSNWLADAKDWNVSRNRYWGTPLPVWVSDDLEETVCVGSVAELEALSGKTGITDIHREFVDEITIPSKRAGKPPLRRVDQVFDCWFESGAMPYGQSHYPFENKEAFEASFPADFIAEGLDQTRGWFYTLLVLSTALFGQPAFKNLIVNGLVLAEDGKKMSKRLKNYPEPTKVIDEHGADALRLYLINSPAVRAEPLRFREAGVREVVRDVLLPLLNVARLFIDSVNRHRAAAASAPASSAAVVAIDAPPSTNEMDRWIVAAVQTLVRRVRDEMGAYRLYTVLPCVVRFVDDLTNWYVRMNRGRLKGRGAQGSNTSSGNKHNDDEDVGDDDDVGDDGGRDANDGDSGSVADQGAALSTLLRVLYAVCRVMAPFTPFIAEALYQRIVPLLPAAEREDSVHYLMLPEADERLVDAELERRVQRMTRVVDLVRQLRDRVGVSLKMPLRQVTVCHPDAAFLADLRSMDGYIRSEVNCVELVLRDEAECVALRLEANMAALGKRLGRDAAAVRAALMALDEAAVREFLRSGGATLAGHALTADDVRVVRHARELAAHVEAISDSDVVVLADTRRDAELIDAWRARELVSRVQQLRKRARLTPGDAVVVHYRCSAPDVAALVAARAAQLDAAIGGRFIAGAAADGAAVLASDSVALGEDSVDIALVRATAL